MNLLLECNSQLQDQIKQLKDDLLKQQRDQEGINRMLLRYIRRAQRDIRKVVPQEQPEPVDFPELHDQRNENEQVHARSLDLSASERNSPELYAHMPENYTQAPLQGSRSTGREQEVNTTQSMAKNRKRSCIVRVVDEQTGRRGGMDRYYLEWYLSNVFS